MATRIVEWKKPYTWWKAITVDENKVISLNLRDENNLIIYDEWDDEIYVDLQLDDEITPTSAFPIWVNVGRVIVDNWWDKPWTIISAETTSGDNIKIFYADEWTLWIDNWTWTFKQIYFKSDVDALLLALRNYIDWELAKKQNWVSSNTAPSNPSEWDLWYDTTSNSMKVWDWTTWQSVGTGWGGSEIVYATQAEYNALPSSKLTDNKHYFIYTKTWGIWQPWINTIAYYPLNSTYTDTDQSWNNNNGTTVWTLTYWNNYCQFSSWNYITIPTIIPYWNNPYTISVWYNTSDSSWHQNVVYCQVNSGIDNTGSALFVYQWHLYYWGKWNYDWDITDVSISNDTWYNIVFTYTWTQLKCFVNGVSKWTFTRTISSTAPNIANIGKGSPEICIGKTSNLIIEDKVRTTQEIQDYYNQTRWDYWL